MSFFDLVQQHHAKGLLTYLAGQLSLLALTAPDEPLGRVGVGVLAHVEAHQLVCAPEQESRQRFCDLGLANPGRPHEQKVGQRLARRLQPGLDRAQGLRNGLDRFALADDASREELEHLGVAHRMLFAEQEHRDPGAHGKRPVDVADVDGARFPVLADLTFVHRLQFLGEEHGLAGGRLVRQVALRQLDQRCHARWQQLRAIRPRAPLVDDAGLEDLRRFGGAGNLDREAVHGRKEGHMALFVVFDGVGRQFPDNPHPTVDDPGAHHRGQVLDASAVTGEQIAVVVEVQHRVEQLGRGHDLVDPLLQLTEARLSGDQLRAGARENRPRREAHDVLRQHPVHHRRLARQRLADQHHAHALAPRKQARQRPHLAVAPDHRRQRATGLAVGQQLDADGSQELASRVLLEFALLAPARGGALGGVGGIVSLELALELLDAVLRRRQHGEVLLRRQSACRSSLLNLLHDPPREILGRLDVDRVR